VKALNPLLISGREVLPLIEGGKGIAASDGASSGAWAAAGGVGTFSGVNADIFNIDGTVMEKEYKGKTRRERQAELIAHAIEGGISQARIAFERACGQGRIHMNILWEMGGSTTILKGILEGAKGKIHGITCGAGMPYQLGEICAAHGVYFHPIVSSARAFNALWKRAYNKVHEWLGSVVYEDPWLAGGHNGLSNTESPNDPQSPMPRVIELRRVMRELGLGQVPIIVAGGLWFLRDWQDWIGNPDLGPIGFQFGTRPLLTQESPIPMAWKKRLLTLKPGDVSLNRFSPTGFYSSAVRNDFLQELYDRSARQVTFSPNEAGALCHRLELSAGNAVFVSEEDKAHAENWMRQGFTTAMRTPDTTLVFVTPERAAMIRSDQAACIGCLSACLFSSWSQGDKGTTGRLPDPRSYCIQKTLQAIAHTDDTENQLMFAGHHAYKFAQDPFYANGFIPTVAQLVSRIESGD